VDHDINTYLVMQKHFAKLVPICFSNRFSPKSGEIEQLRKLRKNCPIRDHSLF